MSASPTVFYASKKLETKYQLNNSLAAALHCTSPFNVRMCKRQLRKLKKDEKMSFDHNSKFLEMSSLNLVNSESSQRNVFFVHKTCLKEAAESNNPDSVWRSSEHFRTFTQKDDKHQVVTCAETGEIIFVLPARLHQREVLTPSLEEKAKLSLRNALILKKNQVNKTAKRRKTEAKKWIFWGKWINITFLLSYFASYPR